MGEQELERDQKELADGGNRQLDAFELAKRKAQEIAARLASDAEAKRPRLAASNSSENSVSAPPPFPVPFVPRSNQYSFTQVAYRKIAIPNGKVGVVIGKGGETIKQIQMQSGAKVQITRDHDADPHSLTRDVDVTGTEEQISRAEELINDVIAEADAGSSVSSTAHGVTVKQSGAEQFAVRVPNDKVGLLIGKGGETIKYMQTKSGARMQIIPLHLPPGDPSTERTVYISGSTEQIEAAKELVNDVINGKRILDPSGTSGYGQPAYASTGNWSQPAAQQLPQYGYAQPANQPTAVPYYNYGQPWDPSNPPAMYQTPPMAAGYGYYGQQPQPGYGYYTENTPAQTEQQNPDGTVSSQPAETVSSYGAYPQTYWQPQTGYGQADYSQVTYPTPYGQAQTQPSNNGHSQSSATGAETRDVNSKPDRTKEETAPSQS